jgi:hypothetical protein
VLARVATERSAALMVGAVLLAAAPWVLANELRPLIGPHSVLTRPRSEQYFIYMPALAAPYRAASRVVADAGCANVGLAIGENGWEYPLWRLMSEAAGREIRIRQVSVQNVSRSLSDRGVAGLGEPCALVRIDPLDAGQSFQPRREYALALSDGPVSVYLRREQGAAR